VGIASEAQEITSEPVEKRVPQSAKSYETRAEECVRLANLAKDDIIRSELLTLRQSYLRTAERLTQLSPRPSK
jgi:hypothetical protein